MSDPGKIPVSPAILDAIEIEARAVLGRLSRIIRGGPTIGKVEAGLERITLLVAAARDGSDVCSRCGKPWADTSGCEDDRSIGPEADDDLAP